jgi:hypothetical protein
LDDIMTAPRIKAHNVNIAETMSALFKSTEAETKDDEIGQIWLH